MDLYGWLGCTSTPPRMMGTAKPSCHTSQQPSGHALVLLGSVALVLSSPIIRGVVKYSLTNRKSIIMTYHHMRASVIIR